jgi:hypothetical protein
LLLAAQNVAQGVSPGLEAENVIAQKGQNKVIPRSGAPTPGAKAPPRLGDLASRSKLVPFPYLLYGATATFPVNSIWAADRATYKSKSPGSTLQSCFLMS